MIYAQLNAGGQPVEIRGGSDQPIYRLRVADEQEAAWLFVPIGDFAVLAEPLTLTAQALEHYGPADFDRYGITVLDDPATPDGQLLSGYTLGLSEAGAITIDPSFAPAPPPPRRDIPKSVVMERLGALGKAAAVFNALMADPLFFGLWFSPDWKTVYADDERLIGLLQSAGCIAEEIAAVTA